MVSLSVVQNLLIVKVHDVTDIGKDEITLVFQNSRGGAAAQAFVIGIQQLLQVTDILPLTLNQFCHCIPFQGR